MKEKDNVSIELFISVIEAKMRLHNHLFPDAKVTWEVILNHLQGKKVK